MGEAASQNPLRVLVVDDCHDTADSLAALIGLWGHDTRVAYNGPNALELAGLYHPDVVLCDLSMPRMDGYTVARLLRQRPGTDRAVLLAMSGYGQDQYRRGSEESGFDLHLVKPFLPGQLQELLAGVGTADSARGNAPGQGASWVRSETSAALTTAVPC